MIILGFIIESIWELIRFPYYVWKQNWHDIPRNDQNGFKIVFVSYAILLIIIIMYAITSQW